MGVVCTVLGHRRDARRAWHDGIDWRSSCARCGIAMVKDDGRGGWRPFDRETDFDVGRAGKPEH